MKTLKISTAILLAIIVAASLLSWKRSEVPRTPAAPLAIPITMCGSFVNDWSDTTFVQTQILSGLGDLHYPVTTKSKEAQRFFDQGIKLIYAFNHWEAIQSFRQAIKLDPEFAMGYWGLALAYGPNLNDVNPKDRERLAFEAIKDASMRAKNLPLIEQDLISALGTRYNGKAYDNRDSLNLSYATAMRKLAKKYPNDHEVLTNAADAIMNTMPWDYWQPDGSPKPATVEAKSILESAIKKFPNHPGAHHLYIHLVEASSSPDVALKSAQFLESAMPGAGHIVHMPAHIYLRTGNYKRSLDLNVEAVQADENYLANSDNRGMYRWAYYPHNIDFVSFSSYMSGRSELAIKTSMKLAYKGNPMAASNPVLSQHFGMEPMIAFARFGKWNDILSLTEPDQGMLYSRIIYHFTRGLALLRTNKVSLAEVELTTLESLSKLDTLQSMFATMNPLSSLVQVPLHILKGEVAIKRGRINEGISALTEAATFESKLRYNEPPDWKIPSRQFLGAALLDAGKYEEAEKVFLEELKQNPENGWSLFGLHQTQLGLNKKADAAITLKRFTTAWADADVKLTAARF